MIHTTTGVYLLLLVLNPVTFVWVESTKVTNNKTVYFITPVRYRPPLKACYTWYYSCGEVTFWDALPENDILVMINCLEANQYRLQRGKKYDGTERCKNLSEIRWPSNQWTAHAMWQESIYIDESWRGWRFVPQRGKRKMFEMVTWKLCLLNTVISIFERDCFSHRHVTKTFSPQVYLHIFLYYVSMTCLCSVIRRVLQ